MKYRISKIRGERADHRTVSIKTVGNFILPLLCNTAEEVEQYRRYLLGQDYLYIYFTIDEMGD